MLKLDSVQIKVEGFYQSFLLCEFMVNPFGARGFSILVRRNAICQAQFQLVVPVQLVQFEPVELSPI